MLLPDTARVAAPYRLAAGTELWRNHRVEYPGASFNPCEGEPTRFAPLRDAGGGCIPGFYAATTFDGAAYETVFRDAPHRFRPVLRQELDRRGVSILAPLQDLALVPLFTPEIAR